MTAETRALLDGAGIRVDDVLERFLHNETLMFRILNHFLDDRNFSMLTAALSRGDTETAFRAAHTLKGVCGNLSMERMYPLVYEQTECLRSGDLAAASAMLPQVTAEYDTLCSAIRKLP